MHESERAEKAQGGNRYLFSRFFTGSKEKSTECLTVEMRLKADDSVEVSVQNDGTIVHRQNIKS